MSTAHHDVLPAPPAPRQQLPHWLDGLLFVLFLGNLFWPTALPLRLNGLPLSRDLEFLTAVALLCGGGAILLALLFPLPRARGVSPAHPVGFVLRCLRRLPAPLSATAAALGLALLLTRLAFPPTEAIAACYSTPELPTQRCLFLVDSWPWTAGQRAPTLSRFEEGLWFVPQQGVDWRLSAFNHLAFNIYSSPPGTVAERREAFRRDAAHPFTAVFTLAPGLASQLRAYYPDAVELYLTYRGQAVLSGPAVALALPFHDRIATETLTLPSTALAALQFEYRNYACDTDACQTNLTMQPLPLAESVFYVALRDAHEPAQPPMPLTTAAISQRASPTSPYQWARLLEWAFLTATLARVIVGILLLAIGTLSMWSIATLLAPIGLLALAGLLALLHVVPRSAAPAIVHNLGVVVLGLPATIATVLLLGSLALRRPLRLPTECLWTFSVSILICLAMLATAPLVYRVAVPRALALAMPVPGPPPGALPLDAFGTYDRLFLLSPGDDPLTYASWAKDMIAELRDIKDPTMVLSKPFFLYYRAGLYLLLGDGEWFGSQLSQLLLLWAVALCMLAILYGVNKAVPDTITRADRIGRGGLAIVSMGTAIWLVDSVVDYAVPWVGGQFSEGPAWAASLLSFALLLVWLASPQTRLACLAGSCLALGGLMRTTVLPLAGIGLGLILWGGHNSHRNHLRTAGAYLLPLLIGLAAIYLHAGGPFGLPAGVREYVAFNTGVTDLQALVPTRRALFMLLATALALAVAWGTTPHAAGRRALAGLVLAVALAGFAPLVPQLAAPYYPRALMPTYYVTALLPACLLVRRPLPAELPTGPAPPFAAPAGSAADELLNPPEVEGGGDSLRRH